MRPVGAGWGEGSAPAGRDRPAGDGAGRLPSDGSGPFRLAAAGIAVAAAAVYAQAARFAFVLYDDNSYITENPVVRGGLTWSGVEWAFGSFHVSNWHPLTWLSHMLDVSLFGVDPGPMHLVNLLLHVANALLLFHVLRRMTGELWKSAFVAAVFAVHPLHVESVAWVAERKDVLSGLFFMLALLSYARYAERPSAARYAAVAAASALGLLSKPMLVTLPLVMLLLDWWPLGRLRSSPWRLILEKAPLFAFSAASCTVTLLAQRQGGALSTLDRFPLDARVLNAVSSCAAYLGKAIWPASLAVLYPHAGYGLAGWKVAGAAILLAAISVLAARAARSRPYLVAGWLWFLVMLAPVIGLVQVGIQAMADRYMYLPMTGIAVAVAWLVPSALRSRGRRFGAALAALSVAAWRQAGYWKDSQALFGHALEAAPGNWVAEVNMGVALEREGRIPEAIAHYRGAVGIDPRRPEPHNNLAVLLDAAGVPDEAAAHYREAIRLRPDYVSAHVNFGLHLARTGSLDEAMTHFEAVLRARPSDGPAHYYLGLALSDKGRDDEAAVHLAESLRHDPGNRAAADLLSKVVARRRR